MDVVVDTVGEVDTVVVVIEVVVVGAIVVVVEDVVVVEVVVEVSFSAAADDAITRVSNNAANNFISLYY